MIETFFYLDALSSPWAMAASLGLGLLFGLALEQAGFGSSRRIAGVFLLRDMTVVKVMFSALVTAMLGLAVCRAAGLIGPKNVYLMPSFFGAQAVGGLLFGAGFGLSGWCPGTSAVGMASGKLDALLFFVSGMVGMVIFNELFPVLEPLYTWGRAGTVTLWQSLGLARNWLLLLVTVIAGLAFLLSEALETRKSNQGRGGSPAGYPFVRAFGLALVVVAAGLFILPQTPATARQTQLRDQADRSGAVRADEQALLAGVAQAKDHIGSRELAERLMAGGSGLKLVDIRPAAEFKAFHIRGAVNIPLDRLVQDLEPWKNRGWIVLYSNGMTHPAQARDALARLGYTNVYFLTDGLTGFARQILKPASLRAEPVSTELAGRIATWRAWFMEPAPAEQALQPPGALPGLVKADWLAANLGKPGLKIIDLRGQAAWSRGHLPGSVRLDKESLRGEVGGLPSLVLPGPVLAEIFGLQGLEPEDLVVLMTEGRHRDATLVGLALERVGHLRYALLEMPFSQWQSEGRPVDQKLTLTRATAYPVPAGADDFSVDYRTVLQASQTGQALILDVRPADYFSGIKSDEARPGHIPGAVNRPFSEDLIKTPQGPRFKPLNQLAAAYAKLIANKDSPVIVHCRTGHQASQTYFVLRRLLGYRNVHWYDAGWTEWAARPELPVATGPGK